MAQGAHPNRVPPPKGAILRIELAGGAGDGAVFDVTHTDYTLEFTLDLGIPPVPRSGDHEPEMTPRLVYRRTDRYTAEGHRVYEFGYWKP